MSLYISYETTYFQICSPGVVSYLEFVIFKSRLNKSLFKYFHRICLIFYLGPKKKMCVSGRPTDPNILYAKRKIDRQNPEIRLRFRVCFRLQQFSSFPCTFDRCMEPKTLYCMSNN